MLRSGEGGAASLDESAVDASAQHGEAVVLNYPSPCAGPAPRQPPYM